MITPLSHNQCAEMSPDGWMYTGRITDESENAHAYFYQCKTIVPRCRIDDKTYRCEQVIYREMVCFSEDMTKDNLALMAKLGVTRTYEGDE